MSAQPVANSIVARWSEDWTRALAAWSSYTQLRAPALIDDPKEAAREGMAGQIAAIRLQDQHVMVNLETVRTRGLEDLGLAILAHEIGHHVYVPGNLADNGRMLASIGRMMPGLPARITALAANLYSDLLINDRLQRRAGIDIAAVYRKLGETQLPATSVWTLYLRTYEHLWLLAPGTLAREEMSSELNEDAMLLARVVRHFASDWLRGARRFGAIVYPYFAKDEEGKKGQMLAELGMHDTRNAGAPAPGRSDKEAIPDGLTGIDPWELDDDDGFEDDIFGPLRDPSAANAGSSGVKTGKPGSQHRQPFEYAQLLKALGLNLAESEIAIRYYRERALPHLIPFPARRTPRVTEPLVEGHTAWEIGDPIEDLDALESAFRSPVFVPGVTTVQAVYGETPGGEPARIPLNLDIYVDSSGSMPHPGVNTSYLALAGTILAMSAIRAGAAVQATLWSGPKRFQTSGGFLRDENTILGIITGCLGGSTAFPLHVLRKTYGAKKLTAITHIVVISDDGADTILQKDEFGRWGAEICELALKNAGGGATMVLNLPQSQWAARPALEKLGFSIHRVTRWEELIAFSRAFVRRVYGENQ